VLPVVVLVAGTVAAIVVSVLSFVSVVNTVVNDSVTVRPGSTGVISVTDPGEYVVFVEYTTDVGGSLAGVPRVVVLDPTGREVGLDRASADQNYSDADSYLVGLSTFEATSTGNYRIVVGQSDSPLVDSVAVVANPLPGLIRTIVIAVVVGVAAVVLAAVITIVVAVRRCRSKRAGARATSTTPPPPSGGPLPPPPVSSGGPLPPAPPLPPIPPVS
jgi:hypothetical protein